MRTVAVEVTIAHEERESDAREHEKYHQGREVELNERTCQDIVQALMLERTYPEGQRVR